MGHVDYKITIFEYGSGAIPETMQYSNQYTSNRDYNVFAIALLQGGGKNILVDTGMDLDDPVKQGLAKNFLDYCHSPQEMLATVGLTPDDIDDVVLTHSHFDHMGALEVYPNAQFYLQRDDLEAWEDIASDPKKALLMFMSVDAEDLKRARALEAEGRLTLLDGDVADLLPGIDVIKTSSAHSFADQLVVIRTPDGPYVDAGDVATRQGNILGVEEKPFYLPPAMGNAAPYGAMKAYDEIMAIVGDDISKVILPHDSYRADRMPYDEPKEGLKVYQLRKLGALVGRLPWRGVLPADCCG
ncbi:MBL fold metallo-hydrolase [Adlercreutzia sp. ZJ473]|uniref:MBL fold metallo-hydrolase n=1 Tax=Adlercreutzia sp. ZJ473 TaxID=2722822 RepID=UPI001551ED27|nr:MBL fold metallo-hydrolase [Adlercreutzia sp. ZJ473]